MTDSPTVEIGPRHLQQTFVRAFVTAVAEDLGADGVLVGTATPGDSVAYALGVWAEGTHLPGFAFDLGEALTHDALQPRHAFMRDETLAAMRACLTVPLLDGDGEVIGTLSILRREACDLSPLRKDLRRLAQHLEPWMARRNGAAHSVVGRVAVQDGGRANILDCLDGALEGIWHGAQRTCPLTIHVGELPAVRAPSGALRQLLRNLLLHALVAARDLIIVSPGAGDIVSPGIATVGVTVRIDAGPSRTVAIEISPCPPVGDDILRIRTANGLAVALHGSLERADGRDGACYRLTLPTVGLVQAAEVRRPSS